MAISLQYAVLVLLQTEPGIDAVLSFGGPVKFHHLRLIADAGSRTNSPCGAPAKR